MKRFRFASPALASLCVASAVVSAARPQYGGTLRMETRATVRGLDPAVGVDRVDATASARIRSLVFEPLVRIDPAGGLRPLLASAWESEAGGVRWRFRLRPGVLLHDGSPLEAWQVAAALRTTTSGWNVSTDGDIVVVEPSGPQPDVPWVLADSRYAIAVRRSAAELIGSGPFKVDRVDPTTIVLRAHDHYWAGRPFVDAVRVETGRSPRAQLADLEAGRADLVEVASADARRVTDRGLRLTATRPLEVLALVFEPNRGDNAFEPARRSIAGAVDRAAITNVLLQGRAEPARELLPAWLSGYASGFVTATVAPTTRNQVLALPIERRSITVRVDPADADARAVAERIAVDLREVGFTATVQAPAGLAPRPDVRLIRVRLDTTSPERALARLVSDLGLRSSGSSADAAQAFTLGGVLRAERTLLNTFVVIPVARVPDLYAFGETLDVWDGDAIGSLGVWNFANVWIRPPARKQ